MVREAIQLKEAFRYMISLRTPDSVAGYRQARRAAAAAVSEAKQRVWEKFGEGLSIGTKVFLEDHPAPQEVEAGNHPSCVQ